MEEKLLHAEEPEAERNSPFLTKSDLNKVADKSFSDFDILLLQNRNTFTALEKLKSKKIIDQLFKEGKSVSVSGLTLLYLVRPLISFYPAQVSFSVPKRKFKHAVDRNRIKRLLREAYRTNKFPFYQKMVESKQQIAMMFVYKGNKIPTLDGVEQGVLNCFKKISL